MPLMSAASVRSRIRLVEKQLEYYMPRQHTGLGTLHVTGSPPAKVVLNIAPDDRGGWQTIRGTITGDPSALATAFRDNHEARLVHDATGFEMHLTVIDVINDLVHVAVDLSQTPS